MAVWIRVGLLPWWRRCVQSASGCVVVERAGVHARACAQQFKASNRSDTPRCAYACLSRAHQNALKAPLVYWNDDVEFVPTENAGVAADTTPLAEDDTNIAAAANALQKRSSALGVIALVRCFWGRDRESATSV